MTAYNVRAHHTPMWKPLPDCCSLYENVTCYTQTQTNMQHTNKFACAHFFFFFQNHNSTEGWGQWPLQDDGAVWMQRTGAHWLPTTSESLRNRKCYSCLFNSKSWKRTIYYWHDYDRMKWITVFSININSRLVLLLREQKLELDSLK